MTTELLYIYGTVILLLSIQFILFIKTLIVRKEYQIQLFNGQQSEAKGGEIRTDKEKMNPILVYSSESVEKIIETEVRRRVKEQISAKKSQRQKVKQSCVAKKLGKPVGGKGGGRQRPAFIDRQETVTYKSCPDCGQSFQGKKPRDKYDRYLLDLIFADRGKYLIAIRYEIWGHYCKQCNKIQYPKIDAPPQARMGWGLITWVIIKRVCRHLSFDAIAADLIDLCQEKISKTTLINWMKQTAEPLQPIYQKLWQLLVKAKYLHLDETGLPLNGQNWWLWVLLTKKVVLYHVHASRGSKAIKDELSEFGGIIISDFWSAYNKLDQEQQKCLVHLIRELEQLIYEKFRQKKTIQQRLQEQDLINEQSSKQQLSSPVVTPKKKRGRPKKTPPPLTAEEQVLLNKNLTQLDQLIWNFLLILCFFQMLIHQYNLQKKARGTAEDQHSSPIQIISFEEAEIALESLIQVIEAEKIVDADLKRIIKRLRKFKSSVLTFLKYEDIPPHNNAVEQKVRPFVMQRKISGTFMSEEGVKAHAIHLSIFETCKINQIDYLKLLRLAFHEKWEGILNILDEIASATT